MDKQADELEAAKMYPTTTPKQSINFKDLLHLDIDFWYTATSTDIKIYNPKQPHYFDFHNKVMVMDF